MGLEPTTFCFEDRYSIQLSYGPIIVMNDSNQTTRTCARCKQTKPTNEFYRRGDKYNSYCKQCNNLSRIEQTRRNRAKAVALLGGKCSECGYSKCIALAHFHHPNPALKDDMFHRLRNRVWSYIEEQLSLQEVILLCANCHAEEHCNVTDCHSCSIR